VEFLIIVFVGHWPQGFGWNRPGGGFEYPLFWGLIMGAIALRGGGPYSLDRKIGWELWEAGAPPRGAPFMAT